MGCRVGGPLAAGAWWESQAPKCGLDKVPWVALFDELDIATDWLVEMLTMYSMFFGMSLLMRVSRLQSTSVAMV